MRNVASNKLCPQVGRGQRRSRTLFHLPSSSSFTPFYDTPLSPPNSLFSPFLWVLATSENLIPSTEIRSIWAPNFSCKLFTIYLVTKKREIQRHVGANSTFLERSGFRSKSRLALPSPLSLSLSFIVSFSFSSLLVSPIAGVAAPFQACGVCTGERGCKGGWRSATNSFLWCVDLAVLAPGQEVWLTVFLCLENCCDPRTEARCLPEVRGGRTRCTFLNFSSQLKKKKVLVLGAVQRSVETNNCGQPRPSWIDFGSYRHLVYNKVSLCSYVVARVNKQIF